MSHYIMPYFGTNFLDMRRYRKVEDLLERPAPVPFSAPQPTFEVAQD
jgi:hypothetical protein